jgi:hypothetical protein
MNQIALALETAQEPALAERSRLRERLSLMRVAPGRLSGTAAKSRRPLFRPLLRLAYCAPHCLITLWFPPVVEVVRAGGGPVAATERGSKFKVGRQQGWERGTLPQSEAAFGIGLGTVTRSRRSPFLPLSQPATARRIVS